GPDPPPRTASSAAPCVVVPSRVLSGVTGSGTCLSGTCPPRRVGGSMAQRLRTARVYGRVADAFAGAGCQRLVKKWRTAVRGLFAPRTGPRPRDLLATPS